MMGCWASIAHIKKFVTEARTESITQWLAEKTAGMMPPYIPPGKKGIHPAIARTSKDIASRYIQLKTRHAATGYFLHKIKAVESAACEWCSTTIQTAEHLWFHCRGWSSQRRCLRDALY